MSKQKFSHSNIETLVSTVASCGILLGFGLAIEVVLGLTASMYVKNIIIRLVFDKWTNM